MCRLFCVFSAASLFLTSCQSSTRNDAPKTVDEANPIQIVVTTSMIADLAAVIGAPFVDVKGLMGPNVDPHLYKASEGDVRLMTGADLVLYSGLHLEGKMVDIFEQMEQRGQKVYALTNALAPEDLRESALFVGNHDPHVWFDVTLWAKVAKRVGELLIEYDPSHAEQYTANLEAYLLQLEELNSWIYTEIERIPENRRVLVTSHDAFGYFGRRYGMEVRGLQGLSTASEAGTADVQNLATFVADRKIPSMFVEASISPRGIEAVLAAVRDRGFEVQIGGTLYGDALGSPGTNADSYLGMVRENVRLIADGLIGEQ
ncbi:MAG: zinc ABC transporter substrate-binding protein [Bacteroidetes bacterium]|nr:zinc ABC transporter substrate-binding protein [Bacteroidota bacterium]